MRIALLACCLAGCSYPEFAFSGPVDANADASDDAAVDSALIADTAVTDTPVADTATSTGCTALGAHFFCHDFDKAMVATDGWPESNVSALGSVTLVPSDHSGPNALLAETKVDAAALQTAHLSREMTSPGVDTVGRVDLWIKLELTSITSNGGYLFKWSRGGDGVTLSLGAGGLYVETKATDYPVPKAVPPGKWMHVRIEAKLHPTTGWFALYIDDLTTPVLKKVDVHTTTTQGLDRRFTIGLYASRNGATLRAYYDDITFDFLP